MTDQPDLVTTLRHWVEALRPPSTITEMTVSEIALVNGVCVSEDIETAANEIEKLRLNNQILTELVLDTTLTPAAKNCVAINLRDGCPAPTPETLEWAAKVMERIDDEHRKRHETI